MHVIIYLPQLELKVACSPLDHLDFSNCNKEIHSSKTFIPPSKTREAKSKANCFAL